MKKKLIPIAILLCFTVTAAANLSLKGYFPHVPGWGGTIQEAPELYKPGKPLVAQQQYIHRDRFQSALVSISMGSELFRKCPMPLGFKLDQGDIAFMTVKQVQGFLMFYTYKPGQKEGRITVYIPSDRRQKIHGSVSFFFKNVKRADADAFLGHFNFKKIKRRMEDLK